MVKKSQTNAKNSAFYFQQLRLNGLTDFDVICGLNAGFTGKELISFFSQSVHKSKSKKKLVFI